MTGANLIIDNDFMTDEQKSFVDDVVLGNNFSWFFLSGSVNKYDNNWFFFHTVLDRPEGYSVYENRVNSEHSDFFVDVFDTFCSKNEIEYDTIFRISANLVFPHEVKESLVHVDHDFPHRQMIVYLNESPTSRTNIFDTDRKTLLHEIKAEKYKGVVFNSNPHSLTNPTEGRRVVIVYTFE